MRHGLASHRGVDRVDRVAGRRGSLARAAGGTGIAGVSCLLVVVAAARSHAAPCADPGALAAVRAAVDVACPCALASSAREYRRCAAAVTAAQVAAGLVDAACARDARRCARRSTCGRAGVVACCPPGGGTCRITTPARCAANGGCASALASCCDACAGGGCATTTTTSTTTTIPANTCGNGRLDPLEDCDGEPFCTACRIELRACCDQQTAAGSCARYFHPEPGPPFCLEAGASTYLGSIAPTGDVCPEAGFGWVHGACPPPPSFPPTTFCCQLAQCTERTFTDSETLMAFMLTTCEYPTFGSHPIRVGRCGTDGQCRQD